MKQFAALSLLALAGCENGQRFDLVCDVTTYRQIQVGYLPIRQDTGKMSDRYSIDLNRTVFCRQSEPGQACSEATYTAIFEVSEATLKLDRFTTIDRTSGIVETDLGGYGSSGTCQKAAFTPPRRTRF
jgi:hypothetical protein